MDLSDIWRIIEAAKRESQGICEHQAQIVTDILVVPGPLVKRPILAIDRPLPSAYDGCCGV